MSALLTGGCTPFRLSKGRFHQCNPPPPTPFLPKLILQGQELQTHHIHGSFKDLHLASSKPTEFIITLF